MTTTQTVVTRTFTAAQPILNDRRTSAGDSEEWDVYAFVKGIKFRATGDPPFEFSLATETWRLLGQPRVVRLHLEPVESGPTADDSDARKALPAPSTGPRETLEKGIGG